MRAARRAHHSHAILQNPQPLLQNEAKMLNGFNVKMREDRSLDGGMANYRMT